MTDGPVAVGLLGDLIHLLHNSDDTNMDPVHLLHNSGDAGLVAAGVRGDPVHLLHDSDDAGPGGHYTGGGGERVLLRVHDLPAGRGGGLRGDGAAAPHGEHGHPARLPLLPLHPIHVHAAAALLPRQPAQRLLGNQGGQCSRHQGVGAVDSQGGQCSRQPGRSVL